MMPIVFCASLAPCIRLKPAAETQLQPAEPVIDAAGTEAAEDPEDRHHHAEPDDQPDQRRDDDEDERLGTSRSG